MKLILILTGLVATMSPIISRHRHHDEGGLEVFEFQAAEYSAAGGAEKSRCVRLGLDLYLGLADCVDDFRRSRVVSEIGNITRVDLAESLSLTRANHPLKGKKWVLSRFIDFEDQKERTEEAIKGHPIQIQFEEFNARGSGGCNKFECKTQVRDGGSLTISELKFALKLCGGKVDQQEEKFFRTLTKMKHFMIEGKTLTLTDEKRQLGLRFTSPKHNSQ